VGGCGYARARFVVYATITVPMPLIVFTYIFIHKNMAWWK